MENLQNIRIAVDAIVFGYQNSQLYVLLIQQKFGSTNSYWALPGGLVKNDDFLLQGLLNTHRSIWGNGFFHHPNFAVAIRKSLCEIHIVRADAP